MAHRESNFYTSYPSRTAELACNASHSGYFDNLKQYVGFGFNRYAEGVVDGITKDAADSRIFCFSEHKKKQMEKVKFGGESTLKGKQLHCLGYLMELAYDLALAPCDNVSSSPGFETCLRNFGRRNSGGAVTSLNRSQPISNRLRYNFHCVN